MKTLILATTKVQISMTSLCKRLSLMFTNINFVLFVADYQDKRHDELLELLENSTNLIVDISEPSTTIGYLLAIAIEQNKVVQCLYEMGTSTDTILLSALEEKSEINSYETLEEAIETSAKFLSNQKSLT